MSSGSMAEILMAAIRFVMMVIVNRSFLRYLAMAAYVFVFVVFTMQPFSSHAQAAENANRSPEQVVSQLEERLKLTDEQETKIRPIIEESLKKRRELLNSGAPKSDLQQLQWATDMQIGKILTEEQMKEYEKLREEQDKKADRYGTQKKAAVAATADFDDTYMLDETSLKIRGANPPYQKTAVRILEEDVRDPRFTSTIYLLRTRSNFTHANYK